MLGAITGDIIGSVYERKNIKTKNFHLFDFTSTFTDDSVMTCAVASACILYRSNKDKKEFEINVINEMQRLGRNYINAGYGQNFIHWLVYDNPKPYNSFGNGSAMRVSPVAWVASSLEEATELAKISAEVSHNHPEGIKGAQTVASAIYMGLHNSSKQEIKEYIEKNYYSLNFTLDEIRPNYKFDVSCQGSVPQAIVAFLESNNYEDTIRNAISIGGDSDTIAAIAGSIAESYYGIPDNIKSCSKSYLKEDLLDIVNDFYKIYEKNNDESNKHYK